MIRNLKIEKILIKEETEWDDSRNYSDDEDFSDWDPSKDDEEEEEDGEVYSNEEESSDEEDHLCYLIRSMFTNYGITAQVDRDELDLSVYIFLEKKEKSCESLWHVLC